MGQRGRESEHRSCFCPVCSCLSLVQLIGFVYGWMEQSFWLTFLWCVGGMLVAMALCVPDWPWFNRHPLVWQPASLVPGTIDPATGQVVQDTNVNCGTCVCGELVHGIKCSSHAENIKKRGEAGASNQADGGAEGDAASTPAAADQMQPAAVEIQAVKVRSNKKGSSSN